jgi:hypothetical protein
MRSVICAVLTIGRSLPVFSDNRTCQVSAGMAQRCPASDSCPGISHRGGAGVYQCGGEYCRACGQFLRRASFQGFCKSAGSCRRALLRWVQIALKPASKTLGFRGVFIRGEGLKYVIADSTFKRMQVDARACWLDTGEHHRGLALRTSGALNEWNDGRQALRLGHDASLESAGARHSLSPVMPRRRSGDHLSMRLQRSQKRVNSRIFGRKVSAWWYCPRDREHGFC